MNPQQMSFAQLYETLPGNGWLSREEAELLYNVAVLASSSRPGSDFLEVGCNQGRSTCLLARFAKTLHCVDPFRGFDDGDATGDWTCGRFLSNLKERGIGNVVLHRTRVEEWATAGRVVSLAYLDGDHSYVGTVNQIEVALTCQARFVAIHDVNDSGGGAEIKRAAVEALGYNWLARVQRLAVWDRGPGVLPAVAAGRAA